MARAKKQNVNNTINIKSLPVQCHIGASKFVNDDWGTMAFSIPRNQIQNKFADPELRYNFIYFLFGYENSKEVVYVGQAKKRNNGESVLKRLREHDDSKTEKYRDKWIWIVAVTNKNDAWGLDDLNALEHAFYNEIPTDQNLNGNNPNSGGADYEAYTDKISQIKSLITAVGFSIFSDEETTEKIQVTSETNEYSIVEDLHNGMARIPEIVTPQKVVKAMVDMLPQEVWNSKTKFLDLACKGGEYLREVYDRLMETEILQSEFPNAIERSNHILKNQIYGIALSQVSLERTTKKLLGEDRNIRVIPDYINKLKGNNMGSRPDGSQQNIMDILNKEFGKNMKFDVVIGNPPYQETNGGGNGASAGTLYDKFIFNAIDIANLCVTMITKNNWISSDTLKETRNKMVQAGLYRIDNYPNVGDIFKGINVAVSMFNIIMGYTGETLYNEYKNNVLTSSYTANLKNLPYIPSSEFECSIVKKVLHAKGKCFNTHIIAKIPFGIETNGKLGSTGNAPYIDENNVKTDFYNVGIMYMDGKQPYYSYTNKDYIPKNKELISYYKIVCGQQLNKNANTITNIRGVLPDNVCSGSFSILYYDTNMDNANNAYKYVCSKFFRLLTYCMVDNMCRVTPARFILVPDQDFTSNSDIDWSKSIADIDQQLYKKYNLTEEEIAYIEQTIKPMA